jgi:hypothetical protein
LLEAVRIGQAGMDRILAVRWKATVIACQSQADLPATRLLHRETAAEHFAGQQLPP